MGKDNQTRGLLNPALAVPVLTAVLGGVVGGLVADQVRSVPDNQANSILVLSVADWLRSGSEGPTIRDLAERLAERGFLVLDDQAVLAAPADWILQPMEEQP